MLLREGIARLLTDAGFEVVAQAGDADDLLRKAMAHRPDVAIVDVRMPPDHEDDGLRRGRRAAPAPPAGDRGARPVAVLRGALALDLIGEQRRRRRLSAQGARRRPRRVLGSGPPGGGGRQRARPEVVGRMLGRRAPTARCDGSAREREVLAAMAEGKSNRRRRDAPRHRGRRREARHRIFRKLGIAPARPSTGASTRS